MPTEKSTQAELCEENAKLRQRIAELEAIAYAGPPAPALAGAGGNSAQRKEMAQTLRRERDFSAAILDTVGALVVVLDCDGKIVRFNRACERLSEYTFAEVQGRPFWEFLVAPEDADRVVTAFAHLRDGALNHGMENCWVTKSGVRRLVAWTNTVLPGRTGEVEYVIGTGIDVSERKELADLRIKDKVIAASLSSICIADLQGSITYVNRSFLDLWGFASEDEVLGRSMNDFVEDQASVEEIGKATAQCGRWIGDVTGIGKSGERHHVQAAVSLVTDSGGRPLCLTTSSIDITARIQAQEVLRASEAQYRRIVETAQEGIWTIDAETKTTFVNRRMAEMLGYTMDEMIGSPLFAFMDEEGKVLAARNLERRRQGISEQHDFKFRRQDGSTMWALLSTNPIMDEHGTFLGALAMLVDITERKQAADDLYRSQQMLQLVLDNVPQRVFWKDRDLHYLGCNQSFAADAHVASAAAINGLTDMDLAWQATAEQYRADDRHVMDSNTPKLAFEEPQQQNDGRLLWLRTNKVPLHDREGNVIGILGTYDDITARKQDEETLVHYAAELERSNQDLEHFAYVASHDLQEPLRMVASYVQILAEDYQGRLDPTADEYIGYAVRGAKHMQQLIQDLLAYSRVSTLGKPFEQTDCQAVFEGALDSLRIVIVETGATITADRLPVVKADRSQLAQVFLNLVGNALKYRSSAAPRVHIGVKFIVAEHTGEPAQWLFSVCDNGIGIEAQYYEKIFVIFQRLHGRSEYAGTGLGLAICRRIIERHHGRIWVESEPGHGSTFYFTLPV